ncbi:MAG: hypothetical protein WKG00_14375 [Polyangiaceae bacterium]
MRAVAVLGLSLLVLCNVGCRYRASAKDYAAVRTACRAGNTAKAEKLTLEMLEDDVFKPRFDAAVTTAGMSESFGIDYCNPMLLNEVAAALERKR